MNFRELVKQIRTRNPQLTRLAAMELAEDMISGRAGADVLRRYDVSASAISAMQRKGRKRQERHTKASRAMELARQAHAIGNELERLARALEED